ncbi:cytochrome c biogenesis heme-transporting ATPase CcmA [Alteromonas sp. 345S023]|uniref:Cytochrome c biogenesis heme-transporting ATPase CcmA n=1 Tax=Alteromonas profundi TaxID=2696062 RepID=A0A7X5LI18_9ALTE|nr:cytochrome c biogenesis heme-transporting ATPase CcmA [Alteromonas profundi]NDV89741.1 cytochrome c biogenesis heme-transporting ATPase CcmA [Alteromonas profundi]
MSGLRASGLTCIKRDRVLFEALSFSLKPGELLYLRGPNGAGKTSLLRIVTGLSSADEGEIYYQGTPIRTSNTYAKSLIYLGHKTALNSALSAIENLHYWAAQHQVAVATSDIYHVLEINGLVGLEDIPVRFLSAGQQRRVALSRLWLKKAPVWILDEPFTALDIDGVAWLERKFSAHVKEGGMLMTTSHQPLSALAGDHTTLDLEYRF